MKGKYQRKRKSVSDSKKRFIQRKLIIFFVTIGTLAIIVACGILFWDNGSKIASGIFAESSDLYLAGSLFMGSPSGGPCWARTSDLTNVNRTL